MEKADSDRQGLKIFVDCRWYSQPKQGVVTYLSALHRYAEQAVYSAKDGRILEFWYGVDGTDGLDWNLLPPGARVLSIGRHGMLWRLLIFPFVLRQHGFHVAHFQYVCPIFKLGIKYVTTIHDVLFLQHKDLFSIRGDGV